MASHSKWILQLTVTILSLWVANVQGVLKCDRGWQLYYKGETCVKFVKSPQKTFADARLACQAQNGDLIRIDDADKQNFFNEIFKKTRTTVWLGLHRTKMYAKTWHWLDDKELIKYTHWNRGEPNNSGSHEDCVTTWYANERWNDIGCTKKFSYYCEKPALHTAPNVCQDGWKPFGTNCFKAFEEKKNFHDAKNLCRSQRAELVTIPTSQTTTFINQYFAKGNVDLWTGLNDLRKSGDYRWTRGNVQLGTYKNWGPNQPDDKDRRCVYLSSEDTLHRWNDGDCMTKYTPLCQKPSAADDLLCPNGWDLYYKEKTCILMWGKNMQDRTTARASCKRMQSDLVKITTDDKNNYIKRRLGSLPRNYWIGLHKNANSQKFTWLDEVLRTTYNQVDTNAWRDDTEYCGTIRGSQSKWGKAACTGTRNYVLCERKAFASMECPAGYAVDKKASTCLKFPTDALNWEAARLSCQKDGGDLAQLNYWSNKAISDMAQTTQQSYWIGLHDRKNNLHFQWLDTATDFTGYKNWGSGQPSDLKGKLNCVRLNPADGMWYDDDCSKTLNYACQHAVTYKGRKPADKKPKLVCSDGWNKIEGYDTCMKYNVGPLTQKDARKACQKTGGDLIKLRTNDKTSFVNAYLVSLKISKGVEEPYIGLSDLATHGKYVWLDETKQATFLNWHSGEPSGGDEHCVVIVVDKKYEQDWNDVTCDTPKAYLCETPATPPGGVNCGPNWEDNPDDNQCYRINKTPLTWYDAQTSCKTFGGDMTSIVSSGELLYLSGSTKNVLGDSIWTGGNDMNTQSGWTWTDHKPFAFFNWDIGEPKTNHSDSCIAVNKNTGKWTAEYCLANKPSVCKKNSIGHPQPTQPAVTIPSSIPSGNHWGCPPKWRSFRNSCYQGYVNKGGVSWGDANLHCQKMSANLVSVADWNENGYLFSLLPRGFQYSWIGLTDLRRRYNFGWSDNVSPVTFTNWDVDQPNLHGLSKVCVAMSDTNGKWSDYDCDVPKNYFVCEKPASIQDNSDWHKYQGCKLGGTGYFDKCYKLYATNIRTFDGAQSVCKGIGGNLATLNDRYTQAFVSSEMYKVTYWIGLSNTKMTTTIYNKKVYPYTWKSGAVYDYSNWGRSHTGSETNTCVAVQSTKQNSFWRSYPCNLALNYLCEYPRPGYSTPVPITTTTAHIPCPKGWIEIGPYCYKVVETPTKSWMAASSYCQSAVTTGGNLASVTSGNLNAALKEVVLKEANRGVFWIGLNDRDGEGGFKWSDGQVYSYTNWGSQEPNNFMNSEDCVEWNVRKYYSNWNDFNCYKANGFICQAPRGSQLITTLVPPTIGSTVTQCGKGTWTMYNGYCYSFSEKWFSPLSKTYFDAQADCHKNGAELTSIADVKENGYLTTLLTQKFKKSRATNAWIGLNDFQDNVYKWLDGTLVTFLAWEQNEPSDSGGERCATLKDNGFWNDIRCTLKRPYICKKRPGSFHPITVPSTTPPTGGCPNNFFGMPGTSRCFRVMGTKHDDRKSFVDAMEGCKAAISTHKARLASIHSAIDEEFITTLLANTDLEMPAWIGFDGRGGYYYSSSDQFFWVDNTKTDFVNWGPKGENGGARYSRRCTEMMIQPKEAGVWERKSCYTDLPYVCEYDKSDLYRPNAPNAQGCPATYTRFRESCYKYISTLQNWTTSEKNCKKDGGHLASEEDGFDNAYIDLMLQTRQQDQVWIGMADNSGKNTFTWSDNTPVMYTSWDANHPNFKMECVSHKNGGKWRTTTCDLQQPSVCQIHLDGAAFVTPNVPGKCPSNIWTLYGKHCYFVETKNEKSWPNALSQCRVIGGELASIHSESDFNAVFKFLKFESADAWIGLARLGKGTSFSWSDQSENEYENWTSGSPSQPSVDDTEKDSLNCVLAQGADGKWVDQSCSDTHAFVCKIDQIPLIPSTTPTTTTTTTTKTITGSSNQCNSNPCQHGGICTSLPASYTCRCRPPWKGQNCEKVAAKTTTTTPTTVPITNNVVTHFSGIATPSVNKQTGTSNDSGMSKSDVAGVVVGVLCVVAIIVVVLFLFRRHRLNNPSSSSSSSSTSGFDNAAYDASRGGINFQQNSSTA